MSFSINTNIASLQAEWNYLQQTSQFQQKTINSVTSRITYRELGRRRRRIWPWRMPTVLTKPCSRRASKTRTTV